MHSPPSDIPWTLQQCGLWHAGADRSSAQYNQFDFSVSGPIEAGKLRDAMAGMVAHSDLLRTSYETVEGRCEPRVVPFREEAVVAGRAQPGPLAAEIAAGKGHPLMPFRAVIGPVDERAFAVSIFAQDLVLDESSLPVLWEQIVDRLHPPGGGIHGVSAPSASYLDYATWQRKFLGTESQPGPDRTGLFMRHMRYWERKLAAHANGMRASADGAHSCSSTASCGFEGLQPGALLREMNASRATPEAILHAAVARSLAQSLGRSQVWIAGNTSGRFEQSFEQTIGVFDIPLLFHYRPADAGSFDALVEHVLAEQVDVHKRPHVPANYLAARLLKSTLPGIADARVTLREDLTIKRAPGITISAANRVAPAARFMLDFSFRSSVTAECGMSLSLQLHYCPACIGEDVANALVRGVEASLAGQFPAVRATGRERCRWRLNRQLYKGRHLTPHDPTQRILAGIWESVFKCSPVGVWDDLAGFASTPGSRQELLDRISEVTGHALPPEREDWTIELQANYLVSLQPRQRLILLREGEGGAPLFFAHGDFGGGGFYARGLLSRLESRGAIYLLSPHGLNGLEIPDTIERMARDFVEEILRICPAGPVMLGGHCNGSLIAFEMARILVECGRGVSFLGAIYPLHPWTEAVAESVAATDAMRDRHAGRPPALQALRRPSALRFERYTEAIARYRPPRADLEATLLLPFSEISRTSSVEAAWRQVAQRVEVELIPGDHLTCITTHAVELGASLNRFIGRLKATPFEAEQTRSRPGERRHAR